MEHFYLDGRSYATPHEVHEALARLFGFPSCYGCNADALNDCLSGRPPVRLTIMHRGFGAAADELALCCRMIEDNRGHVDFCSSGSRQA